MIFSFVGLSVMRAQQAVFQSKLLSEIGKSIGYIPNDTLPEGIYTAGTFNGLPVVAQYDNRHTVTHLGIKLFSQEMRDAYASDVYDFLERYFLELFTWKKTDLIQKLEDDKVMFITGSMNSLRYIKEDTPFSIYRAEDKYYEVSWKKEDGEELLAMAFPINYELLLGMPQVEIANTMYDRIVSSPTYKEVILPDSPQCIDNNVYRTEPLRYYQLEDVNNSLYVRRNDDQFALVVDTAYINYSVTNVLQQPTFCNNPISVEQSVYGFKKLNYTITISKWIDYCHGAGLNTYVAIEEEYDDAIKVLLVAENKDLGYNHLLSFIVPRDFIVKPNAEIKCQMSAFVPTHNVKNLYQQYSTKPKKRY